MSDGENSKPTGGNSNSPPGPKNLSFKESGTGASTFCAWLIALICFPFAAVHAEKEPIRAAFEFGLGLCAFPLVWSFASTKGITIPAWGRWVGALIFGIGGIATSTHATVEAPLFATDRVAVFAQVEKLLATRKQDAALSAIDLMNKSFDPKALNTDPELKTEMDRIKAEGKTFTLSTRTAAYANAIDTYALKEVAELAAKPPAYAHDLWASIDQIDSLARQVEEGEEFKSDPNARAAQKRLKKALAARQALVFPALRSGYQKVLRAALFDEDIDVKIDGGAHRNVTFIGGTFAANRNISTAQEGMSENLKKARFSKSRYRWIPSADGIQYDLQTPPDTAIGYFENGVFKHVN